MAFVRVNFDTDFRYFSWEAISKKLAFFFSRTYRPTLEEVRDRMLSEISEFARIEERAPAGSAFLEPDVLLLRIDHS